MEGLRELHGDQGELQLEKGLVEEVVAVPELHVGGDNGPNDVAESKA